MRKLLFLILALHSSKLYAQLSDVTVNFSFDATQLITNCWVTPSEGGAIYLSGSFNGWGVGDEMTKNVTNNTYFISKVLKKKAVGDSTYAFKLRTKATTSATLG